MLDFDSKKTFLGYWTKVIDETEKTQLACYPRFKPMRYEAPVETTDSARTSMKMRCLVHNIEEAKVDKERLRTRNTMRPELVRALTGSMLQSQDYSTTSAPFTELTGYEELQRLGTGQ